MSDMSAQRLVPALKSALRSEANVRFALLFGSTASGEDGRDSDVDLLVGLGDSSLDCVVDLDLKIGQALGRSVDIVRLQDAASEPTFFGEALSGGQVLLDRDRIWPQLSAEARTLAQSARAREADRARAALDGIDRMLVR